MFKIYKLCIFFLYIENVYSGCKCLDCTEKATLSGRCTCGSNHDCGYIDKPGSACVMCQQCWYNGKCGNVDNQGNYDQGLGYLYYNSGNNPSPSPSSSNQISEIQCKNYEEVCDGESQTNLNCSAKRTTCNCKTSEKCTCYGDSSRCFYNSNYKGRCSVYGNDAQCYNGGETGEQRSLPNNNVNNVTKLQNCQTFNYFKNWVESRTIIEQKFKKVNNQTNLIPPAESHYNPS